VVPCGSSSCSWQASPALVIAAIVPSIGTPFVRATTSGARDITIPMTSAVNANPTVSEIRVSIGSR
jgi:hypothetical protein